MSSPTGETARPGPPHPRTRVVATGGLAVVALVALGRTGAKAAETTVEISGFSFVPEELAISAGDTVTWVNKDEDDHDLKAGTGEGDMDSPPLKPGESYSFRFPEAREVTYTCSIHTYMKGTIHVAGPSDGSGEAPPPRENPPPPPPTTTTTAPRGLVPFLPVESPEVR